MNLGIVLTVAVAVIITAFCIVLDYCCNKNLFSDHPKKWLFILASCAEITGYTLLLFALIILMVKIF